MIETLAHGYSSDSTHREISNEYQHDSVYMIFKNLCILELHTKIASVLERFGKGFGNSFFTLEIVVWIVDTFCNYDEMKNAFTNYLKRRVVGIVLINLSSNTFPSMLSPGRFRQIC